MNATIREWYRRIDRTRLALVGTGGIGSAEDAYRTIRLGASLVLVYTALPGARNARHVCSGAAPLRAALARHAVRVSGLARRLRKPSGAQ
jgi:dihydroorotate dehydrogenase